MRARKTAVFAADVTRSDQVAAVRRGDAHAVRRDRHPLPAMPAISEPSRRLPTIPRTSSTRSTPCTSAAPFSPANSPAPTMNDGGSIVITSSVAATRGDPGVYAYITAKHAQIGLMRCLAKELAPRRIRVNTIHPGPIDNQFQLAVEKGSRRGDRRRRHRLLQPIRFPCTDTPAPRRSPAPSSISPPIRAASPPEPC